MTQSPEANYKELYHNRWVSLRQINNYVYSHETRSSGQNVAVLIYDDSRKQDCILGRFELCPAHFDGFELCSFTGGVEKGDPAGTAIHEIKEEAGYVAKKDELRYLGTCRPSKSADTLVHLFSWDAQGKTPGEIVGDGSAGEVGAFTKWVNANQAFECKDPLMATLLGRFFATQS